MQEIIMTFNKINKIKSLKVGVIILKKGITTENNSFSLNKYRIFRNNIILCMNSYRNT